MSDIQEARKKIEAYLRLTGLHPYNPNLRHTKEEYAVFLACKEAMLIFIDRKIPISHIRKFTKGNFLVRKMPLELVRESLNDFTSQSAFIIIQKESRKNVRKDKKAIATK